MLAALVNLGWYLWSWQDRSFAEGDRRYFRGAEQGHEIDYGLADIRIINETGREYLIDSFVLDGWGGPYTHQPDRERTLAPAGMEGFIRDEQRHLEHLIGSGRLILREGPAGPSRLISFQVDRRRPTSCLIEVRIQDAGETVTECNTLRRVRSSFRWMFGPPDY